MSQHNIPIVNNIDDITEPGVYRLGKKIVTYTGSESKVEQSQRFLTDVNRLLEPAMKKGLLRHVTKFAGEYDDIPVRTYQEAQMIVAKAKTMYQKLPADIRKEFNTPDKFLKFVQDPKNAERMQQMGILKGNDGLTAKGTPSGAPTPTDKNGDGVPDPISP